MLSHRQEPLMPARLTADLDQGLLSRYEGDGATPTSARIELERRYMSVLETASAFNRRLVSYQANKSASMHRWFKYKEGFSARLVNIFLREFGLNNGQHILDPFAGVATTLLVARANDIQATGIELLPLGDLVWKAKSCVSRDDVGELKSVRDWVESTAPGCSRETFPHLRITRHAFDGRQEAMLMWYRDAFESFHVSPQMRLLLQFVLVSILEDISYTSKDGQFLRWDSRSEKARARHAKRKAEGKRAPRIFRKGVILDVKTAILKALDLIIFDISQMTRVHESPGRQALQIGSALDILPTMTEDAFDAVITSPPYCNRYDYTRTYALELAFLGNSDDDIIRLRQELLSCTVENRPKAKRLCELYSSLGRQRDHAMVLKVLADQAALQETLRALRDRKRRRELNNAGIVSMVEGYFTEMAFVIHELCRVCKDGARVAIVNDNVRYGGEVVPVDLLLTDLAVQFGFSAERIYVLPQRKGNSSQQMGKYGREALRKSILVWKK